MKLPLIIVLVLGVKGVPFTPMEVERLPDLNIPREAHGVALAGGEFTVFGGHTTGFVSTPTADAPDGTSGWFLPSMFQWQQAIHAMTGKTTEISLYETNADYTNDKFSTKIADSEAHLGKFCYASSSEFDATYNWHFDFNDGIARRNAKWCTYYVRAFLAF